jgi:hypothetical protein
MKLKFNADAVYNGKIMYKAGKIYEVSEELGWAQRWIFRGAEIVESDEVVVETSEEPVNNLKVPARKNGTKKSKEQ